MVTENEASIGYLRGRKVSEKISIKSNLKGKHKAGGQSAQRWSRDRKEKKKQYYKNIGENLSKLDSEESNLVIGGPNITRKDFLNQDIIPHNMELIGQFNVNYTGLKGLRELAEKSKDIVDEEEMKEEKQKINKFFKSLREGKDAYGKEKVEKYIEQGRVETLLLSEDKNETNL